VSIDGILYDSDRTAGAAVDRWIAIVQYGVYEFLDERNVDVRGRRMRFDALLFAHPQREFAGIQ
jgi:hypothetical protein